MARGRRPSGAGLVDGLEGSPEAKRRMKLALETLEGKRTVLEACQMLGISEAAFHKFRIQWLQYSLGGLEPKRRGRPPKAKDTVDSEEVRELREEIAALRKAARIAAVREEIAVAMPGVLERARKDEKKTR